ncbi:uncharacterized protein LOC123525465 [Mercenaria mercenaria]|uniref:uncharacterized protein LOC123525465 n=1 Tax=Mercenaria mercenaria TaxID=6596 RepID=UPI00234F13C9|nr:uncharacterized protein LOC123525465 [Mercenaria mercenaria]
MLKEISDLAMGYRALFLVVLIGMALAGPAADISQIRITSCTCSVCNFKQIGYALRGTVRAKFNGSQVSCSQTAITNWRRIVTGWNHSCRISGSSGGKFEVSYNNGAHQICGRNYDHVYLNSCRGTPCSNIG